LENSFKIEEGDTGRYLFLFTITLPAKSDLINIKIIVDRHMYVC